MNDAAGVRDTSRHDGRIVVTGAAGFIGSEVVDRLILDGRPVRGIDIRPPDLAWQSPTVNAREIADGAAFVAMPVEFVLADLLDPLDALHAIAGAEVVIHLAGPVLDHVKRDPLAAVDLQVRGTLNVLEAARRAKARKVILASTFYVYSGLDGEQVANERTPIDVALTDTFGTCKLMAERLVRQWGQTYGLNWTILRFGSVYGWHQRASNIVKSIVETGMKGETFEVWGKGARRNQYTWIGDVVEGIVRSIDHADGKTLNLISPEVVTIAELAGQLEPFGMHTKFDADRPDPASTCYMASYAAERELGMTWTPLYVGLGRVVGQALGDFARNEKRP